MTLKKWLSVLCGVLLALCLAVAALAAVIDGLGGSSGLMLSLFEAHAPTQRTGLPQEHYPAMADMVTDYLSGRMDSFQYTIPDGDGTEHLCFNATEQHHMRDVKQLFVLARSVMLVSLLLAALWGFGAWLLRAWKRFTAAGALLGVLFTLAALTVLAVWAALDFNELFVLFHQISFSNNLWLLNPQTDLLIRLMPTDFFIHYAILLGGTWLAMLALTAGVSFLLCCRWKGSSK